MTSGLNVQARKLIVEVLHQYPDVERAFFFGSRAMGNFKKGSDVDIVLKGPLKPQTAQKIRSELEEHTPLPYFFDIINYAEIENPQLKEHVDRWGKEFYRQK